ncbi:MAG: hypothetical protein ACRDTG_24255, partial [Pseudonocardiaceae bacterium]
MGNLALEGVRCNVVLERLLGRAGWAPENLGDHLNRLAAKLGLKIQINRRYPRRWVYAEKNRPTPRIPRDPWPSLVCLLLHQRLGDPVTPQMLGWPIARGMLYVPADDQGQFKFTRCLDFVTLGSKEGKCSVSIPADTLRRFFNALHSV